jgi:hypothetical protein
MRRLVPLAVAAVLLAAPAVFAADDSAPVTVAEGESTTTSSESGGSGLRGSGGFFDANDSTHRKMMLSFFAEFHWPYYWSAIGPGLGVRFAIPIVKNGFVPAWNDSFWIEFGVSAGFHGNPGRGFSFGLTIPAQAMWMVHLIKNLAVYAKVSFGVQLEAYSYANCGVGAPCSTFWAYFHGAGGVGLVYNLSDSFALRAEILSSGFSGGIAIQF